MHPRSPLGRWEGGRTGATVKAFVLLHQRLALKQH